ncbi:MAG: MFS transporter [Chloroflexota bacterium]
MAGATHSSDAGSPPPRAPRLQAFHALRYRDYRLLWFSTLFSSSGQWFQQVTLGWLAYEMTGSALVLGLVNGLRALPLLLLGPLGGVAADRMDKRVLMVGTQAFLVVAALAFAALVIFGHVEVWHVLLFSALTGVGWALNTPVRQTLVSQIVPREELMHALALNAAGFNATRIAGPALAGVLIATLGPGENFLVQALAYAAVAALILPIRLPLAPGGSVAGLGASLVEGVRYVSRHPTLRTQLILVLVPVLVALPYTALLPVLARDTLGRGAGAYGLMVAAPGAGAVAATLVIASLTRVRRKGRVLLGAIGVLGAALLLVAVSRWFPVTLLALALVGAAQMTYTTTNQALMQLTTPPEYRGRVMGIYMLNQGLLPLGSVLAGVFTDLTEVHLTLAIMGGGVAAFAAVAYWRARSIRELVAT